MHRFRLGRDETLSVEARSSLAHVHAICNPLTSNDSGRKPQCPDNHAADRLARDRARRLVALTALLAAMTATATALLVDTARPVASPATVLPVATLETTERRETPAIAAAVAQYRRAATKR